MLLQDQLSEALLCIMAQILRLDLHFDLLVSQLGGYTCYRAQCCVTTQAFAALHWHQIGLFVAQKRDENVLFHACKSRFK